MNNNILSSPIVPNILIVDDIPANLIVLGDILEGEGYNVRPVLSGLLALQVAEKEKPDLILLDIMMPDMDGFEVCRRLRENKNLCDVPIIFISALNETKDIVKALTTGGADYITKPFSYEEVIARVNTHLNIYLQRKELQEQSKNLNLLNAAKDKFFSIIAHDLRGPFIGFLGLTKIMAEELPSLTLTEMQEISESMKKSAVNLFRLLDNLLNWAKMQQGLIPYSPEYLTLLSVITESVQIIDESAKSKIIEITYDIPTDLKLFADSNLLQTVIRNIVSNAVKFTPKGGKIIISAKVNDQKNVQISIKDTGIGMSSALIDNLFRLDVKTGRKGTEGEPTAGLGLLLCKEFVEKNRGVIWAESVVGEGSTFYFTLPQKNDNSQLTA